MVNREHCPLTVEENFLGPRRRNCGRKGLLERKEMNWWGRDTREDGGSERRHTHVPPLV